MGRIAIATGAAAMLLVLPHIALAGDIIYNIDSYAADQNGWTLTGTITTDGNVGVLAKSDILAWTWTVTQESSSSTYTSTDPGAGIQKIGTLMTNAAGTEILLSIAGAGGGLALGIPDDNIFLTWTNRPNLVVFYAQSAPTEFYWDTSDPQMGGYEPWIIAGPLSVPEPGALVLAASACACGVGLAVARKRRGAADRKAGGLNRPA